MMPDADRPPLTHAPGCSDAEGIAETIGYTVTTWRCLHCGAIATERHDARQR